MSITGTKISVTLGQLFSIIVVVISLSVAIGAYRSEFSAIKEDQADLVIEIKALTDEMGKFREAFARVGQKLDDHLKAIH